jgi:hypothetical protein
MTLRSISPERKDYHHGSQHTDSQPFWPQAWVEPDNRQQTPQHRRQIGSMIKDDLKPDDLRLDDQIAQKPQNTERHQALFFGQTAGRNQQTGDCRQAQQSREGIDQGMGKRKITIQIQLDGWGNISRLM